MILEFIFEYTLEQLHVTTVYYFDPHKKTLNWWARISWQ